MKDRFEAVRALFPFDVRTLKSVNMGPNGRAPSAAVEARLSPSLAKAERAQVPEVAARGAAMRGWIALCRGRGTQALERLSYAVSKDPKNPTYRVWRAVALRSGGDLEGALLDFSKALALDPNAVSALLGRSETLKNLGRLAEALADAQRLVKLVPREGSAWRQRARLLAQSDRKEEALSDLQRSVELEPGSAEAHSFRGEMLRKMGHLDEALSCFDMALRCRPAFFLTRAWRGAALLAAGRPEALAELRRAHRALPDFKPLAGWIKRAEGMR